MLTPIVEGTSEGLLASGKPQTSVGEMMKYFGIRMTVALEQRVGAVADWFRRRPYEKSVKEAGNYEGKYSMKRHRFEDLTTCLKLYVGDNPGDDPWFAIRGFVNAFNTLRVKVVKLGQFLVVDEMMSSWLGIPLSFNIFGIPHTTKIARKPKGVGAEFKSAACGYSGIIIQIEIQEGKDAMRLKRFAPTHGAGASTTFRLTEPWHGQGRTVIGDSWFGSVTCLLLLRSVGTYFMGMVKTATRMYPMQYMKQWYEAENQRRDAQGNRIPWGGCCVVKHTALTEQRVPHTIYALGYRDRKMKTIISNKGTTLPGRPLVVDRTRVIEVDGRPANQNYKRSTPRPQMMEQFFMCFSKIDVHDHRRQGVLKLEQFWKTQTWWHRIFASLLGVCIVDSYLAYMLESASFRLHGADDVDTFNDWASKLAHNMIFNEFDNEAAARARPRRRPAAAAADQGVEDDDVSDDDNDVVHILASLSKHPKHLGDATIRMRCRHCGERTVQYCVACSITNPDGTYYIHSCCNPFSGTRGRHKKCYFQHLKQCNA